MPHIAFWISQIITTWKPSFVFQSEFKELKTLTNENFLLKFYFRDTYISYNKLL